MQAELGRMGIGQAQEEEEAQNHRIVESEDDPQGSSSPTPNIGLKPTTMR